MKSATASADRASAAAPCDQSRPSPCASAAAQRRPSSDGGAGKCGTGAQDSAVSIAAPSLSLTLLSRTRDSRSSQRDAQNRSRDRAAHCSHPCVASALEALCSRLRSVQGCPRPGDSKRSARRQFRALASAARRAARCGVGAVARRRGWLCAGRSRESESVVGALSCGDARTRLARVGTVADSPTASMPKSALQPRARWSHAAQSTSPARSRSSSLAVMRARRHARSLETPLTVQVVVIKSSDDGTKERPYAHAVVAGISRYPKKVCSRRFDPRSWLRSLVGWARRRSRSGPSASRSSRRSTTTT